MSNTITDIQRPRTLTRIAAVQALFQWEQGGEKATNLIIEQFLLHRLDAHCSAEIYDDGRAYIPNINLFKTIIEKYVHQSTEIDALLIKALPEEWPLHRIDPVVRAILRAAVTELLTNSKEPPTKVVINEYIDVTHAFCDGDASSMVNGILDNLGRQIRSVSLENE